MISITEIIGTNKISASRSVINSNFFTLRDAVNSLLTKLNTNTGTDADLMQLYTAVSTVSPVLRFKLDSNTGKLTVFDNDGVSPKIILDKTNNGTITLSNLNFSTANIGNISMTFPGSAANLRNCNIAETLISGGSAATDPVKSAQLFNGVRYSDGVNTPIAISNVTATYTLDLSTSYKNLIIFNSLYATGSGTNVTVSLGSLTENQADGLETSIFNNGANPIVLGNVTYNDGSAKTIKVLPTGYVKIRRVNTGLSATWVIVAAFNTIGV